LQQLGGGVEDPRRRCDGGVVDEDVDGTEACHSFVDDLLA
jgi:hypothetical protein